MLLHAPAAATAAGPVQAHRLQLTPDYSPHYPLHPSHPYHCCLDPHSSHYPVPAAAAAASSPDLPHCPCQLPSCCPLSLARTLPRCGPPPPARHSV